jgi:DNA polymerase-3 subunit epsilon
LIDTETTGLDPKQGHRIIELAAVELVNRRLTGRHLHYRIDPERDVDYGATEVHGMTREDLRGMPCFRDIAGEFADFARGSEWIIHNAPFDTGFLDAEFARLNVPEFKQHVSGVIDTLAQAKEMYPGKRNSLDALCERYGISNAHRKLHGALLDAELLAEVYLAMTRGQETLIIDMPLFVAMPDGGHLARDSGADGAPRYAILAIVPAQAELDAHREYLEALARESKAGCLWLALEQPAPDSLPEAVAIA